MACTVGIIGDGSAHANGAVVKGLVGKLLGLPVLLQGSVLFGEIAVDGTPHNARHYYTQPRNAVDFESPRLSRLFVILLILFVETPTPMSLHRAQYGEELVKSW